MAHSVSVAPVCASKVPAGNCNDGQETAIRLVTTAGPCKWFSGLAKFLSPNKPAAAIHYLTDEPERTCYEWVRGKFDPPSRVVIKLLHTDQGWRVLDYLMRGSREPWWQEVVEAREGMLASDARRAEVRQQSFSF